MTIYCPIKHFEQFLSGNTSNKSLDSYIHAIPSNKYCLIQAIQSEGGAYPRGERLFGFWTFRGGAYSREGVNSNKNRMHQGIIEF